MEELVQRLRKVGTGLGMIYASICLYFFVMFGMCCGVPVAVVASGPQVAKQARAAPNQRPAAQRGQNAFDAQATADAFSQAAGPALAVLLFTLFLLLVAYIMDLAGRFSCLSVPPECHGTHYLHISMFIVSLGILYNVWWVLSLLGVLPIIPPAVTLFMAVAGIAANVLFMIFLQFLGEYIHRDDLAASARTVLIMAIVVGVLFIGCILSLIIGKAFMPLLAILGMIGMLAVFIGILAVIFRYASLLSNMRRGLEAYAEALDQKEFEFKPISRE